eukprot:symbB.v1.2.039495.t1/scaffold6604.1/size16761/1
MDGELKTLLAQDCSGPLKSSSGAGWLRMGLGCGEEGLPPTSDASKKTCSGDRLLMPSSTLPRPLKHQHLHALAESLEKLQWTEQLRQLQHLTKLPQGQASTLPVPGHKAWRPQPMPQESPEVSVGSVGGTEQRSQEQTPTEDLASDAAIAWLLSLDPSPESRADSRSGRDFRAEARSRVQERRQREEEMEEMSLQSAMAAERALNLSTTGDSHSDDEFYAQLWGV